MSKSTHERDVARASLRRRLPVGSIVYVEQRNVSRDGMTRRLSLFIKRQGKLVDITEIAATAMGEHVYRYGLDGGAPTIRVSGCGMDMHFHLVYGLARAVRPNGHRCTGLSQGSSRCPSNDHSNDWGDLARRYAEEYPQEYDETNMEFANRRSWWISEQPTYDRKRIHSDGGYSLTHRTVQS